ncbi:acetyltransferase [Chryseobacterium sp. HSC-36S06]|uniref:acetyltransferase n=1 Tax=Chryseobacterium sp. HSC-36S06 TaxID=2910970 RepID=UPI00209E1AFA|nr:acetyltransferase [Chryseobacterium sp. HSC-36S06]MCP2037715.1 acetyltransferase EpsM [Chryseobacterium sp. HSC-36S06]
MIVFGASGHSKVVLDVLLSNGIEVEKVIDDSPKTSEIFGIRVEKAENIAPSGDAIIAVGSNMSRKRISERWLFNYQSVHHPSAAVSPFAKIGAGTVVMPQASINADTAVGKHCIINTGAVVEHDCLVGDFAHVAPNASLAGGVVVGEGAHIGIGACVIQGITIGKWALIGAGAVIIKDVPDFATVVGNPGKIIKEHKNH